MFSTWYSTRPRFLKPRFGRRRCIGIWPPSNHDGILPPVRAFWPLWPLPAVPPSPVAEPLPRRLRRLRRARRRADVSKCHVGSSYCDFLHLHQVADLEDHAPDLGRVVVLDRLLQAADPERLDRAPLVGPVTARALDLTDAELTRPSRGAPRPEQLGHASCRACAAMSPGRRSRCSPSHRRLHQVVRVAAAEALGEHVLDARDLEHRAHARRRRSRRCPASPA